MHTAQRTHGFTESVIQDVDIPIAAAADFLAFLLREIGIDLCQGYHVGMPKAVAAL